MKKDHPKKRFVNSEQNMTLMRFYLVEFRLNMWSATAQVQT